MQGLTADGHVGHRGGGGGGGGGGLKHAGTHC